MKSIRIILALLVVAAVWAGGTGAAASREVVKLSSAKTLNGKNIRIRTAGANVFVNASRVTAADVTANNGVIHVVNRVLLPPAR